MAISTIGSGTQACTISTEHSLVTDTTAGVFVGMFNLTNGVNGDVFVLRIKCKVLTGDTAEEIYKAVYANDQGALSIVASPPVTSMFSIEATVQQTAGTGRNVAWSLLKL